MIRRLFSHPLSRGLNLDSPELTHRRIEIIKSKPFLKKIYEEWYSLLVAELPPIEGPVVELGSGAGFLTEFLPKVITTEVFECPNIAVVADARKMPVRDCSLRAIVMTDVLHHIPDVEQFFAEASRCLKPGGKIIMIEPWVSNWSKWIYQNLHHEPFRPEATSWSFPSSGPLSGANGAIPWIVFHRDRARFESMFPSLSIDLVRPFMGFRYLISGGVSLRTLVPVSLFGSLRRLEAALDPDYWSMFALISITAKASNRAL